MRNEEKGEFLLRVYITLLYTVPPSEWQKEDLTPSAPLATEGRSCWTCC